MAIGSMAMENNNDEKGDVVECLQIFENTGSTETTKSPRGGNNCHNQRLQRT